MDRELESSCSSPTEAHGELALERCGSQPEGRECI